MKYIFENGIIDEADTLKKVKMKKKEELLKEHPYEIWKGNDGRWKTYIPDSKSPKGRRLVAKKDEDTIKGYVMAHIEDKKSKKLQFKTRYDIWIIRQKNCGISDNTICRYEADYKKFFLGSILEEELVTNITSDLIIEFFVLVLNKYEITWKALRALFGYLTGIFEKCIRDRIIEENPCKYVDLLELRKKCTEIQDKTSEQQTINSKEIELLLLELQRSYDEYPEIITPYAIELAIHTGMRPGELSALKWEDIDYNKGLIKIHLSEKYNRKTKEYFIDKTKTGKTRHFPLTDGIKDVLLKVKKAEMKIGTISEFVFSGLNGRVHASAITNCAMKKMKRAGITDVKCIYTFRRTLNSKLKSAGMPTVVAAAMLGHTKRVNEENYTYDIVDIEEKRRYIEKVSVL